MSGKIKMSAREATAARVVSSVAPPLADQRGTTSDGSELVAKPSDVGTAGSRPDVQQLPPGGGSEEPGTTSRVMSLVGLRYDFAGDAAAQCARLQIALDEIAADNPGATIRVRATVGVVFPKRGRALNPPAIPGGSAKTEGGR